jgi:alkylresorcinol/alkylpyrone synthase
MPPVPRLLALASAVPPYPIDQEDVQPRLEGLFGRSAELQKLLPVFRNCGVRRRYSAVPPEWFEHSHSWPERNRAYLSAAVALLDAVTGLLLDRADIAPEELGAIVVVSTTGIATPSLDALLVERRRLPRPIQRLPIFGLGCAGGAIGLARAATLAAAMPDKAVLFLVVELCTLAFRRGEPTKSNIVATALFGDGAAGALLRCGGSGPAVIASGEHTWPQSLDVMGWEVAEDGLKVRFSHDIPRLIAADLAGAAGAFLAGHGLASREIDRFACHPGGPKVIAACEEALRLAPGSLGEERAVLRDFGNMSAATVLFVLERVLARARRDQQHWRRALVTALGPGFTAAFTLLSNQ